MADNEGKPFGTGEGVFGCYGDTLRILLGFPPLPWEFHYESDADADQACTKLRESLRSDRPAARRLVREFSVPNMRAFLHEFLPRNGLIAFVRPALLALDRFRGLRELTAEGIERPVHFEDLIDSTARWQQEEALPIPGMDSPIGRVLLARLSLDPSSAWTAVTQIRDSDGPDNWESIEHFPS